MARHSALLRARDFNQLLTEKAPFIEWCASNGIKLVIKNENHHWIFTYGNDRFEWWPSQGSSKPHIPCSRRSFQEMQALLTRLWLTPDDQEGPKIRDPWNLPDVRAGSRHGES